MTPPPAGHSRRVLMLLGNNPYPQDPRVRKEATALHGAGHHVTVLAPRHGSQPFREDVGGVSVVRFPWLFQGSGFVSQALDHVSAAVFALGLTPLIAIREGFDVVHVHNPPDTFGLVAALWQLRSRKFVYDHHDLAAEMYLARSGDAARGVVRRSLEMLERLCCRRSDRVIATNASYREVEVNVHGTPPERISIVRNGPDTQRFPVAGSSDTPTTSDGDTVVCYAGVIGVQDGVDELVRAMHHLVHHLHRVDIRCVVVGDGDGLSQARCLAERLGVASFMDFTGLLEFDQLVERVSAADVCVEPAPSNPYNDRSTTIKIMEYLAAGKPVVAYDLPEHRVTGGDVVQFVPANHPACLAQAIVALADDPARRRELGRVGRLRSEQHLDWVHQAPALLRAYELLDGSADG